MCAEGYCCDLCCFRYGLFAVGVYTQSFSGLLGVETEYLFINELKISHDIDKYFFSNCFEQLNLAWQFASLSSWAWQFLEH